MFRRGIAIILISLSLYGLYLTLGLPLATSGGMDGATVTYINRKH